MSVNAEDIRKTYESRTTALVGEFASRTSMKIAHSPLYGDVVDVDSEENSKIFDHTPDSALVVMSPVILGLAKSIQDLQQNMALEIKVSPKYLEMLAPVCLKAHFAQRQTAIYAAKARMRLMQAGKDGPV